MKSVERDDYIKKRGNMGEGKEINREKERE
jgi:hypothetical protein